MKKRTETILFWALAALPFVFSALFYSRMPEQTAVHWDAAGNPNGYASRAFAAFGLPAILLGAAVLVRFIISADPKRQNIERSPQVKRISVWSVVILANVVQGIVIFSALDYKINVSFVVTLLIGVLFAAIGNYLPKCKPNYTVGIKLPWTLANEENWVKTHRFAGPVWIAGGVLLMLSAFFPYPWPMPALILAVVLLPSAYSYLLYRRESGNHP